MVLYRVYSPIKKLFLSIIRYITVSIMGMLIRMDMYWKKKLLSSHYKPHMESITHSVLNHKVNSQTINYPIVLLHGMFGFGYDNHIGVPYFLHIQKYFEENTGVQVFAPFLGAFDNWLIRCFRFIFYMKDNYPEWDVDHPVHLVGHSLGGLTAHKFMDIIHRVNDINVSGDQFTIFKIKFATILPNYPKMVTFDNMESIKMKDLLNVVFDGKKYGDRMVKSIITIQSPLKGLDVFADKTVSTVHHNRIEFDKSNTFKIMVVMIELYIRYLYNFVSFVYDFGINKGEGYDSFMIPSPNNSIFLTDKFALWEMTPYGTDFIFKKSKLLPHINYLAMSFTLADSFIDRFSMVTSNFFILPLIFMISLVAGLSKTDGLVPQHSQIGFDHIQSYPVSDIYSLSDITKGKMYHTVEYGDHMFPLFCYVPEYTDKLCLSLLNFIIHAEK